jgi:hypothetical protein
MDRPRIEARNSIHLETFQAALFHVFVRPWTDGRTKLPEALYPTQKGRLAGLLQACNHVR